MKYVLALDQGTTSSRAIIFDKEGAIVAVAQQEFEQIYPQNGWVEHNPQDILGSIVGVMAEAIIRAGITAGDLSAIGITNQRETTIVWDKNTGKPVYNAIVWQCRRTADFCDKLKRDGFAERIYNKTGLVLDAYFSATKIKWILDNVKGARARAEKDELLFGTIDTYLLWHLSKGKIFATDYTNASRTMLFNVHTLEWDNELLQLFDIPKAMLPQVHPSGYNYGFTDESITGAKVPLCAVVGDQQSALFGQLCVDKGDIKNTYGTGCFLLMNTGDVAVKSQNGLITTLGASLDKGALDRGASDNKCASASDKRDDGAGLDGASLGDGAKTKPPYVLEGSVFIGGAVVQWLRDEMRLISTASESEELATKVADSNGVYVVPAFTGLGAPYWNANARGTITGITRGVKREHVVRASLEAIAYQVYDVVCAMQKDAGVQITTLNVDGGASQNNFLMGFQSDLIGCKVVRPAVVETTALGAAYLAGLTSGYWKDIDEIKQNVKADREFMPNMDEKTRQKLVVGWQKAVDKTLL